MSAKGYATTDVSLPHDFHLVDILAQSRYVICHQGQLQYVNYEYSVSVYRSRHQWNHTTIFSSRADGKSMSQLNPISAVVVQMYGTVVQLIMVVLQGIMSCMYGNQSNNRVWQKHQLMQAAMFRCSQLGWVVGNLLTFNAMPPFWVTAVSLVTVMPA